MRRLASVGSLISTALSLFILSLFVAVGVASAQTYTAKDLPILTPVTDLNGVEVSTGTLITQSPFDIHAPGANHLTYRSAFDGRRATFDLEAYMEDNTFDWSGAGYRDIKIHALSRDFLFRCSGYGLCADYANSGDGSSLNRGSGDMYVFTSRDGTVFTFFAPYVQTLAPPGDCSDDPCNFAGYSAFAAVEYIKYPSGEKLTFDATPTWEQEGSVYHWSINIQSNLGYTLKLTDLHNYSTPQTINPGMAWIGFGFESREVTLQKSGASIKSVKTVITPTFSGPTNSVTQDDLVETDDINRTYQLRTKIDGGGGFNSCSLTEFPVRIISPRNIETDITYDSTNPSSQRAPGNYYPVRSLSKGGYTWQYTWAADPTSSGSYDRLTVLNPSGSSKVIRSIPRALGFDNFSGCNATSDGLVNQYTDEINRATTYTYNSSTYTLTQGSFPEGTGYQYEYDARKNLTKITQIAKPGSGSLDLIVYEASFDDTCTNQLTCNQPNWIKDANGNQTDFTYSPTHGGLITATLPPDAAGIRRVITYTYTAYDTGNGLIYRVTQRSACTSGTNCANTASEERTTIAYWGSTFLPQSITHGAGDGSVAATSTFTYDAAGRPVQSKDANANVTYMRYDSVGRLIGKVLPPAAGAYQAERITYNADDQITLDETGTVASPSDADWASFSVLTSVATDYDSLGHKIKVATNAGAAVHALTQYSYDPDGRLLCTAVRMNPATFASEPADACTLGTAGTYGPDRITKNVYDAAGQPLQVIKAYSTAYQLTYATYAYSPDGKKTDVIDANGNHAQLAYDGFDRLQTWTFPSKTPPAAYNPSTVANAFATAGAVDAADYEQYGYDANGNRTTLRKRDSTTIGYTYDALNRMTFKDEPTGSDVYYGYDLQGHQLYARFGSTTGVGITNTYDALGRLLTTSTNQSGTALTIGHQYDADGNRTQVTHPDTSYFVYGYDGLDRLTSIEENGATAIVSATYNPQGTVATLVRGAVTTTYGYDPMLRPNSIADDMVGTSGDETETLTYNPASQIVTDARSNDAYAFNGYVNVNRSYTKNGLNQYTAAGSASFGYDANGNLTSDGSSTYSYDPENRLLTATGLANATLTYDPLGRLYQVTGSAGTTRFLYDGDELVAEYDGSNTLLRRFVHGNEEDDPLIWYEGSTVSSATRRSLEDDHQVSIISVADASGNLIHINSYDEYGIPGLGNIGRFQYTGQAWLPELGMDYYKARIYSPSLGRFMQTDPVGYKDQINLYAYVANDPVNKTDPTGENCAQAEGSCSAEQQKELTQSTAKIEEAHPTATAVVVGGAAVMATGGTALAVAPEVAAAAPVAAAGEEVASSSTASVIAQNAGNHTVYQEVIGGVTKYVGQTGRTLAARAGEHLRETGRVIQPVVTGLNRAAARATEQALIEAHGLAKEGGTLANRINSIARNSPTYQAARQLGSDILKELGY